MPSRTITKTATVAYWATIAKTRIVTAIVTIADIKTISKIETIAAEVTISETETSQPVREKGLGCHTCLYVPFPLSLFSGLCSHPFLWGVYRVRCKAAPHAGHRCRREGVAGTAGQHCSCCPGPGRNRTSPHRRR